jgi:hypothetical protein
MIRIIFTRGTAPYKYTDALHFTEEEYAALAPEAIEALKDQRYMAWYEMVSQPSEANQIVETPDG